MAGTQVCMVGDLEEGLMRDAWNRNKKGIEIMLLSSFCACLGQMFWKLANGTGVGYLFGGFAFYGCGALAMIIAYRYGELSVLQPVMSMNYVLSLFIGLVVFGEHISVSKVLGVVFVIIGVITVGVSSSR